MSESLSSHLQKNSSVVKYGFNYGFNDVKYTFTNDKTNNYYILEKKYEPINQYKNEYDYLYNDKTNGKKLQNYKLIHK